MTLPLFLLLPFFFLPLSLPGERRETEKQKREEREFEKGEKEKKERGREKKERKIELVSSRT